MAKFYADKVKKMIEDTGMSVREFAIRNRITPGTLGMWLRGERNPKFKNVEHLARLFRCSVSDISDFKLLYETDTDRYQINQEHCGADVAEEVSELKTINNELEKLKNKKLDEQEEHYKRSLEEDALKIRASIEIKTEAARRERENPAPLPANIPPFPGKSAPDTIRNTPELRECIKDAMLREGVRDASELNRRIGYDSSHSLERLLNGKLPWFPDVLSAVLDGLNIKQDDAPISPTERGLLAPEGIYNHGAVLTRPIPVVDWANAACHIASLMSSEGAVMQKWDPENTEVALAPVGVRRNTQAFRVKGESMEPTIGDGDILFCEEQYGLNGIPSGKVVIVRFSDDSEYAGTAVCKRYRRVGDIILLTSDNEKAGKSFEVRPQEIGWIGVVVSKNSDL